MTHTLVPSQVDRAGPVEQQTKGVAAKIVKETGAGFIIRRARMVMTLCAFFDELLAAPSTYLNANDESLPYAYSFSIPASTPGLRFMCRPSFANLNAASPMNVPFSSRFDEGGGMVIFDMFWCRGSAPSSIAMPRCATGCSTVPAPSIT